MYTRLFLFGLLLFLSSCGTRYASITYREVDKNKSEENTDARKLMLSSVLYITVVQIIYVVDKFLH